MKPDAELAKIVTDLLVGVRDLGNWGLETGNLTPEQMRLTVAARAETAKKLVESGASQRQAAKLLGVNKSTIARDVGRNAPQNGAKRAKPKQADNAERAEARCAAQWKAFTAEEERNAVSDILEAIRGLTDEQRALLYQTLKESYQWT